MSPSKRPDRQIKSKNINIRVTPDFLDKIEKASKKYSWGDKTRFIEISVEEAIKSRENKELE